MFKYPTPKQIAFITIISFEVVVFLLLITVKVAFKPDFEWFLVILIVFASSIPGYFIIHEAIQRFLYRKIKLIYKTITDQKAVKGQDLVKSKLKEATLDDVEQEVISWTENKSEEINELKRLEEYRKEFLGNVSHELKTPVFNIQGYIESLIEGGLKDERINMKYLQRAGRNVDRLTKIIEDLEVISLIENHAFNLEYDRFNICDLASDVLESMNIMSENSGIQLGFKYPSKLGFEVYADREKIKQVLINLVSNSIRYGKRGGETRIGCYDMHDNVLIEVSDNGLGIEKKHLPRLFERFYMVDKSRSVESGGTGLGLSIVKHILEAHRQTINVRSTYGVGSTFGFMLRKA